MPLSDNPHRAHLPVPAPAVTGELLAHEITVVWWRTRCGRSYARCTRSARRSVGSSTPRAGPSAGR